jgi:hypothetical protein
MDPVATVDMLQKYGGWACFVLALMALVSVDRDRQACYKAQVQLVERLVKVMEAATSSTQQFEDTLGSLRATLDARGQTVGDLSHRIDLVIEKIQHGLGNLGGSMQAIANWIEREKERDRGRSKERDEDRAREDRDREDRDRGRP